MYKIVITSKLFSAKFSNWLEYSQTLFENANHREPIKAEISLFVPMLRKWYRAKFDKAAITQFSKFKAYGVRNGQSMSQIFPIENICLFDNFREFPLIRKIFICQCFFKNLTWNFKAFTVLGPKVFKLFAENSFIFFINVSKIPLSREFC